MVKEKIPTNDLFALVADKPELFSTRRPSERRGLGRDGRASGGAGDEVARRDEIEHEPTRFPLDHAGPALWHASRIHWLIAVRVGIFGDGPRLPPTPPVVSRIAFGSCATQARPQPIWDAVAATRPELLLMLGDNIYADTEDMDVMRAKYARLAKQPG